MDYQLEQQQELESLSCIYPEELTIHSPTSFTITLETFIIDCEYPSTYPDELIQYSIHSDLLDEEEIETVKQNVQLQDYVGMVMVFTLVSMVQEEIDSMVTNREERENLKMEQERERLEQLELEQSRGTKVTLDSFNEWKKSFLKEAREAVEKGRGCQAFEACLAVEKLLQGGDKVTGKELFKRDKSLLQSDEQYMEEGQLQGDMKVLLVQEEEQEALVFTDND